MFKVTGTGPAKAKLTPDYSAPIADEQQATNAGTVTWAVSREAQIRSEVTLLYPQDVMTPPATTTGSAGDLDKPQENGSASTTASQAATGDAKIDGILSGVKWAAGITYSDVDSAADYQAGYSSDGDGDGISAQNEGFSQFTAQQTLAMHTALNNATYTQLAAAWGFSIEGFTNLTIDYAGAGAANATIRAANSSDPSTAYAYYPNSNIYGGDTFFGNYYDSSIYTLKNPVAGNYAWHTMLHELGHSLGLKHGQETGGPANVALPYAWDSIEFSVMTYRSYVGAPLSGYTYEQWGAPQTYMMLDIAALQTMYGADYSVQSGDTVYTWSPTTGETYINGGLAIDPGDNRIFATIWDGGGIDTYDLSNYSTNLTLDLNPGGYSVFSNAQLAYLGSSQYARGNIFNALLFNGNTASMIENAIGGSGNDTITGNDLANALTGGSGSDYLSGGKGDDVLDGGDGDDTLLGGDGNDIIDGASGADLIYGGAGNDIIYGGWMDDTVYGEAGDDIFVIRQSLAGTEFGDYTDGGSGTDRLDLSQITTAYGAAVNLDTGSWQYNPLYGGPWTITGVENVDGTQLDDVITGNSSVNVLNGNGGNDTIYGGGGSDTINGGSGNDTIYGDAGNDIINGGSGNDVLIGGDGNDVFDGGDGTDLIYGEGGNDTFLLANGWTGSYGEVFLGGAGSDTFDISAVTGLATSTINLTDGTFTYTPGSSGPISLSSIENVVGSSAADEITGSGEINRLAGLAGNDILFGLGGDDMLDGGAGNDLLDGGTGIDTAVYGGATSAVTVSLAIAAAQATGGAGTDTLTGIENLSGSAYNDTLTGDAGNNVLDGRVGADTMTGRDGNDTYYVDNVGDLVVENSSTGGTDDRVFSSVSYSLTNRTIETLTLTGVAAISATGNSKAQTLNGNDAANTLMGLDGNDVLNGFGGDDTLDGGNGDDSLDGNDGIDTAAYNTATSAVTVSLAVAGAQATGGAGTDTLANIENLIGSAYNDTLTGNSGANVINGKAGSDTMAGGDGNDIYYVDNVGDVITETSTGGSDTVYSSVSYSVSSTYVETLILTGSAAINASGNSHNNSLTGNSGANVIQGGGGNDVLNGGLGADTLSGGSGSDIFVFNSALGGGNVDSITDYSISNDTIRLDDSVFTGLALGALAANAFYVGTAAHDADDRIIYNSSTGALFFDADGNGAGAAIQFATLTTGLPLVASEFVVI